MFSGLDAWTQIPRTPARAVLNYVRWGRFIFPEFGSQTVDQADIRVAHRLLESEKSWLDNGRIREYEVAFASWNGSKAAYSFLGGRVALSAAIAGLDLKPNDEVIVPGYTCIVVPNAFLFAGINVRYCDIELDTYGPDVDSIKKNLTVRTRAILVHHLYGLVARDLEKILELARSKNLFVIEDCAHATGAIFEGKKVGNFGDIGFYSSEQSKMFSTFNGGMVVTNDEEIAGRIASLQLASPWPSTERTAALLKSFILSYHLQTDKWRGLLAGYHRWKYKGNLVESTTEDEVKGIKPTYYGQRMPSPLAELGIRQLEKIDTYNARRRQAGAYWTNICDKKGLPLPLVVPGSSPVFLRFPTRVPAQKKYDTAWGIREFGVRQGVWFSGELHPVRKKMQQCPNAALAVDTCINLPTLT